MSPARKFIIKIITTFFYTGYLPFIPGTFGSLAAILIFYLVKNNVFAHLAVILILTILGLALAGEAEKIFNRQDPRQVVVDEVVGMLLGLLFLPYDIKLVVSGFFIFRLLDTLKPYPIRHLERRGGSIGIMTDDIVAGLYTNIVLQAVLRLALCRTS